jgi:hypothetical protein
VLLIEYTRKCARASSHDKQRKNPISDVNVLSGVDETRHLVSPDLV